MRCEVCGSRSNVEEEVVSPDVVIMSCKRCRSVSSVVNTTEGDTRKVKKVPLDLVERNPPTREWTEHLELKRIWERLHTLHAETTQSEVVDAEIQRRFGKLKGDPHLGLYRLDNGEVVVADGEIVEIEL